MISDIADLRIALKNVPRRQVDRLSNKIPKLGTMLAQLETDQLEICSPQL